MKEYQWPAIRPLSLISSRTFLEWLKDLWSSLPEPSEEYRLPALQVFEPAELELSFIDQRLEALELRLEEVKRDERSVRSRRRQYEEAIYAYKISRGVIERLLTHMHDAP